MASTIADGRRMASNDLTMARLRIVDLEARVNRLEFEIEKTIQVAERGEDLLPRWRTLRKVVLDVRARWTPEAIIEKVHEWVETYGRPPAAADWNPAQARRQGSKPETIERFLAGDWPQYSTAMRHFPSWNAMIEQAGYEGRDGPEEQSAGGGAGADHLPPWAGWEHIAHLRERLRITQDQAAHAAGISMTYYVAVERGQQTNPSVRILLALAKGLGVRPEALI